MKRWQFPGVRRTCAVCVEGREGLQHGGCPVVVAQW